MKQSVLFLCTHNSARSQMAEGLLRAIAGDRFESHSAGTEETRVHPLAIEAMRELGIDISAQRSKLATEFLDREIDYAVTVCDRAKESCPVLPGAKKMIHWSFDDPSAATGSDEQRLAAFRDIRDQIRTRLAEFVSEV